MPKLDPSRLGVLQEGHRRALRTGGEDSSHSSAAAAAPRTGGATARRRRRVGWIGTGLLSIAFSVSNYQKVLEEIQGGGAALADAVAAAALLLPRRASVIVPDDAATQEDLDVADLGVPESMNPPFDCGCPGTCDDVALARVTRAFGCQKRIQFLMSSYKRNLTDACAAASGGGTEPCGRECHPEHCRNASALRPSPFNWTRVAPVERPPKPFVRHDGVVIATKVLWPKDMAKLKQMICLFTAAYNRHVNYDIVVFTTVPWKRWHVEELRSVAPDTKITVVRDSPPLQDQLATMSPDEISFLYDRCKVKDGENITWFHHCSEPGYNGLANLGYSWQAEFRSYHIWKTQALADYKYMIWMDGDSFCTKPWLRDPIQAMVDNDLVLMIDNFPQGATVNPKLKDKLAQAYGRSACSVHLPKDEGAGFSPKPCDGGPDDKVRMGLVHGFMHVTSLDFYRREANLRFLELMVGDFRFSREWDDQLAVTVPAAMLAPGRVRDLRSNGFDLGIHHNGRLDGKERNVATRYTVFWKKQGRKNWAAAREMCDAVVVYGD